jgi:hypothetical protein
MCTKERKEDKSIALDSPSSRPFRHGCAMGEKLALANSISCRRGRRAQIMSTRSPIQRPRLSPLGDRGWSRCAWPLTNGLRDGEAFNSQTPQDRSPCDARLVRSQPSSSRHISG